MAGEFDPGQDYNYQFHQNLINSADNEAKAEYQRTLAQTGQEDQALKAAQFAWKKTYEEAGLTGYYQGAPTMGTQQWWASNFGTWATPTAGQETMAREQQSYNQALGYTNAFGQYYAPGTAPTAGQQTLGGQAQAFNQAQALAAMYGTAVGPGGTVAPGTQTQAAQNQQFNQWLAATAEQRAAETARQQNAQAYLTLLSNLRGPADWAKYQEVLGAGGNMNSLAAAAMGQYIPGGGATSGMLPQAANLNTLYGQVAQAGGYQPQQWQPQPGYVPQQPYGEQAPPVPAAGANRWGYQAGPGGTAVLSHGDGSYEYRYSNDNPWNTEWGSMMTPAQQQLTANQQAPQQSLGQQNLAALQGQTQPQPQQPPQQQYNAYGNGTNAYGAQAPGQPRANQMNLPAPNQIALQSWNQMQPSQQQNILGEYEAQGWYKPDVENLIKQQQPKYASNAATAGTWRLR